MAQIEAESLPGEVDGESRTLGPGEADIGVAEALYGGVQAWPDLARALERRGARRRVAVARAVRRLHRPPHRR